MNRYRQRQLLNRWSLVCTYKVSLGTTWYSFLSWQPYGLIRRHSVSSVGNRWYRKSRHEDVMQTQASNSRQVLKPVADTPLKISSHKNKTTFRQVFLYMNASCFKDRLSEETCLNLDCTLSKRQKNVPNTKRPLQTKGLSPIQFKGKR